MRRYWEIDQTFAQPSESLLKKNLKESVKKQKEKGNKLEPVVISGRAIAKSWWGKAWCDNLEHYADFASRLERGKRYVRTGTVIDLKIQKGKIIARVARGTKKKTPPYQGAWKITGPSTTIMTLSASCHHWKEQSSVYRFRRNFYRSSGS